MKRCVAFAALALCLMGLGFGLDLPENEMAAIKGKYCGKNLADVLSIVCDGVYNNKQKKNAYKNSLAGDDYNDVEPFQYAVDNSLPFPFKSREHAKSIIPMEFRKRNRGIVDECCLNACSLYEMTGYCGRS